MPDNSNSIVQLAPYAVRFKHAMGLAGVGKTELWKRLNAGIYQSFLDGNNRMVVTQSIFDHQRRLAEKPSTPASKPSKRRNYRRRKVSKTETRGAPP